MNYENGNVKNVHYGDILTKFGDLLDASTTELPFITGLCEAKPERLLSNGDVVIADTAEDEAVGKATEILNIEGLQVVSGLHTIPCTPTSEFSKGYLGFYLNSTHYRKQLYALMQGIKVLSISKSNLSRTIIRYPKSQNEQQQISNMLLLLDKLASKQTQIIENLKLYKRGVLQLLFKENDNDAETTSLPLNLTFKITRGNVLATTEISDIKTDEYCYPVYSSQTKNDGLLGYYNEYLFENAITWTTDGANAGFTRFRSGKFYCTNVCGVLLSEQGNSNEYIAEKINSISKKYVSYVGNPKLMNNTMGEITIPFPTVEKQRNASKIINKIDDLINASQYTLDNLRMLKNGLLQNLFI